MRALAKALVASSPVWVGSGSVLLVGSLRLRAWQGLGIGAQTRHRRGLSARHLPRPHAAGLGHDTRPHGWMKNGPKGPYVKCL